MGNSVPGPSTTHKSKRVVIVGFSFAGLALAQSLWDHFTVTVIDAHDYWENISPSVKLTVDPEYADEIMAPFKDQL